MTTIMPQSELMRNAVRFIAEGLEKKDKSLEKLLEDAAVHFNLSPKESEFLTGFYRDNNQLQD